MKTYFPYKSDRKDKKYFIVTQSGRKVYFGATGYDDFTTHGDEKRRQAYVNRHKKNEDWNKSGIDTAGFWSYWFLWRFRSKKDAYDNIKKRFL